MKMVIPVEVGIGRGTDEEGVSKWASKDAGDLDFNAGLMPQGIFHYKMMGRGKSCFICWM